MQHHILGMQLNRDAMLPCRPVNDIVPLSTQRRNGRTRSGQDMAWKRCSPALEETYMSTKGVVLPHPCWRRSC